MRRLGGITVAVLVMALATWTGSAALSLARSVMATTASTFTPGLVARAGASSTVFVLGIGGCGKRRCLELWRGYESAGGTDSHFQRVMAPPDTAPGSPGDTGSIARLVFANAQDGYALETTSAGLVSFVTHDGGRSWHRASFEPGMSVVDVAASAQEFYAVFVPCSEKELDAGSTRCRDYRLGRSPADETAWSSVPIPGATNLLNDVVSLAVAGSKVWLSYEYNRSGALPQLLASVGGGSRFTRLAQPALAAVIPCSLYPMTDEVLWAWCPTGMQVSLFRSTDAGRVFKHVWTTMGTIGSFFDPVSATVGYRYEGLGFPHVLERTTDGGTTFRAVGRFPFATSGFVLFVNSNDGYATGPVTKNGTPAVLFTSDGGLRWSKVAL